MGIRGGGAPYKKEKDVVKFSKQFVTSITTSCKYYFWLFVAGVCYHAGNLLCLLGFLDTGNWFYQQILFCTWRGQARK